MVSPKLIIGLLIFILSIHILATIYYWYWTVSWLDMPMHFLGGFWVAMAYFWLRQKTRINADQDADKRGYISSALPTIVGCLSFVALVGVLWEFSEFFYDIFISVKGYSGIAQQGVADTMSDLFFDLLGGLIFLVIYKFQIKIRQNEDHFLE